jgi:3-phenylpropionate/cinnamic acid dioxygenase small subunit
MDMPIYLIEKDRLIDRVTELFVATDARDWSQVQACFADTVHFDQTSLVGGKPVVISPVDITKGWDEGLKPLQAIHHQIGNLQIELDDDQATVRCYGIAYHYLPNRTGKDTRVFVGSYEFKLVKKIDSWKISSFVYKVKFIDGNKELEKSES